MNYRKLYFDIIHKAQCRTKPTGYTERHHIVPVSLGGNNIKENLVSLTIREHFLVHWCLYRMSLRVGGCIENKMRRAFAVMTTKRRSSHVYDSPSSKYARRCTIGTRRMNRNDHVDNELVCLLLGICDTDARFGRQVVTRVCACGCGESFECFHDEDNIYIYHHHLKDIVYPSDVNELRSVSLINTLSNMSADDMATRMKRSFGSCDNNKRRESISRSKRGVKTNQTNIMGNRFADMTDDEFSEYLSGVSYWVHKRYTNLRNRFIEGRRNEHN